MSRFLLICVVALACSAAESRFRVENGRVQVLAGSEVVAESPAEGLWSIACDWPQGWPAAWQRAAPAQVLREGEWTILRGEMNACGGVWALEDAYRMEEGVVRGRRRWSHQGAKPAAKVTLSVRWRAKSDAATALLPGILYYGNPSGARSGRVPVAGPESMFEEHRYPMPFASVEMRRGNRFWGAALHTVPSPAPYGNLPDQWWSLGTIGSELVALSGPCASNGKRSVIKGVQRGFVPYENAWLTVEPGAVIEKSYYLEAYPVDREGSGFEQPVRTSIALFRPFYADDLPGFADILRAKYRYAKTRWREADGYAVFQKYVDRKFGVMGWTGQAEAPGYALQVLAPGFEDPQALRIGAKIARLPLASDVLRGRLPQLVRPPEEGAERERTSEPGAGDAGVRARHPGGPAKRPRHREMGGVPEKSRPGAFGPHSRRVLEPGFHQRSVVCGAAAPIGATVWRRCLPQGGRQSSRILCESPPPHARAVLGRHAGRGRKTRRAPRSPSRPSWNSTRPRITRSTSDGRATPAMPC